MSRHNTDKLESMVRDVMVMQVRFEDMLNDERHEMLQDTVTKTKNWLDQAKLVLLRYHEFRSRPHLCNILMQN